MARFPPLAVVTVTVAVPAAIGVRVKPSSVIFEMVTTLRLLFVILNRLFEASSGSNTTEMIFGAPPTVKEALVAAESPSLNDTPVT